MARQFDGIDQYLSGASTPYRPTANWTIAVWCATTSNLNYMTVVGGREAGTARGWGLRRMSDGRINLNGLGSGANSALSAVGAWPADGEYHLIVVRINGANTAYFYVDGVYKGNDLYSAYQGTFAWTIGAVNDEYVGIYGTYWDGPIAELATWRRDIGIEGVNTLSTHSPKFVPNSEYHWQLGGFGGRHDDETRHRLDLTPINSPTWADHPTGLYYPSQALAGTPTNLVTSKVPWHLSFGRAI